MTTPPLLTPHQSQYYAWQLTRRAAGDTVESLASTLVDAQVDLNPHQVEAALFACRNPLSRGVILADEVGLGKTIEAGLVISQRWAERRRKILIIVPANLRKQWHQELQDKFGLQGLILEAKSYNALKKSNGGKHERRSPFLSASGPIICSYQFAKARADDKPAAPQKTVMEMMVMSRRVVWVLKVIDGTEFRVWVATTKLQPRDHRATDGGRRHLSRTRRPSPGLVGASCWSGTTSERCSELAT